MKKKHKVTHPELGESIVVAEDKLGAVSKAAKSWGVAWTSIARQCEFEVLGEPAKNEKPKTVTRRKGKAVSG